MLHLARVLGVLVVGTFAAPSSVRAGYAYFTFDPPTHSSTPLTVGDGSEQISRYMSALYRSTVRAEGATVDAAGWFDDTQYLAGAAIDVYFDENPIHQFSFWGHHSGPGSSETFILQAFSAGELVYQRSFVLTGPPNSPSRTFAFNYALARQVDHLRFVGGGDLSGQSGALIGVDSLEVIGNPEPTALTLGGLGALILLGSSWRRWRRLPS